MAETLLPQLLSVKDLEELDLREIEILKMTISRELDTSREILRIAGTAVEETLKELGKDQIHCKPVD